MEKFRKCIVDGCETKILCRGLCQSHYDQARRSGELKLKPRHGWNNTPTHITWEAMIRRCTQPNASNYGLYGGSGISVCDRWKSFELFLQDMGEKPHGKSLDRIDSSGNYEPENCRWATHKQQARNTKSNRMLTIYGKTMCVADWHDIVAHELSRPALSQRLNKLGWSDKEAVFGRSAKFSEAV